MAADVFQIRLAMIVILGALTYLLLRTPTNKVKWTMAKITPGKRQDITPERPILEAGEYGFNAEDGQWYIRVPQEGEFYAGMGRLSAHRVIEHEDGTISVSPSILVTGHHDKQWHGYLVNGQWQEL